jgi:hypothetical protein
MLSYIFILYLVSLFMGFAIAFHNTALEIGDRITLTGKGHKVKSVITPPMFHTIECFERHRLYRNHPE